jgi:hypothetical protein
MLKSNAVPKASFAVFCAISAYAVFFMTIGRPAPAEGFGQRVDWEMVALTLVLPLALFAALAIGLWRAFKHKDYLWMVLQLVFMPLAYLYTLVINTGVAGSSGSNASGDPDPSKLTPR